MQPRLLPSSVLPVSRQHHEEPKSLVAQLYGGPDRSQECKSSTLPMSYRPEDRTGIEPVPPD